MARTGTSENRQWYASKLDGIGPHASKLQNERFDLAVSYLETHCVTTNSRGENVVDREKVCQQLNSIDFHKPVELKTVRRGDQMFQHSSYDRGQQTSTDKVEYGEHFTKSGTPSERLGITVRDDAHSRATQRCTVKEDMVVLQTHTRSTIDVWSQQRMVNTPVEQTPKGTTVRNEDLGNRNASSHVVAPQGDHRTRSIYSSSTNGKDSANGTKILEHRSGEYVTGGGVQYHLPKRTDNTLLCRHNNLTPVNSQKHGAIRR